MIASLSQRDWRFLEQADGEGEWQEVRVDGASGGVCEDVRPVELEDAVDVGRGADGGVDVLRPVQAAQDGDDDFGREGF